MDNNTRKIIDSAKNQISFSDPELCMNLINHNDLPESSFDGILFDYFGGVVTELDDDFNDYQTLQKNRIPIKQYLVLNYLDNSVNNADFFNGLDSQLVKKIVDDVPVNDQYFESNNILMSQVYSQIDETIADSIMTPELKQKFDDCYDSLSFNNEVLSTDFINFAQESKYYDLGNMEPGELFENVATKYAHHIRMFTPTFAELDWAKQEKNILQHCSNADDLNREETLMLDSLYESHIVETLVDDKEDIKVKMELDKLKSMIGQWKLPSDIHPDVLESVVEYVREDDRGSFTPLDDIHNNVLGQIEAAYSNNLQQSR